MNLSIHAKGEKTINVTIHPDMMEVIKRAAVKQGFIFIEAYVHTRLFQIAVMDHLRELEGPLTEEGKEKARRALLEWLIYDPANEAEREILEKAARKLGFAKGEEHEM